jgi:hypothetical protein
MVHTDRVTLAILLCRIRLRGMTNETSFDNEFSHFLR